MCVCTKSIQQRGTKEDDASNFLDKEKKGEIFWLGFRVFLQSELFITKLYCSSFPASFTSFTSSESSSSSSLLVVLVPLLFFIKGWWWWWWLC